MEVRTVVAKDSKFLWLRWSGEGGGDIVGWGVGSNLVIRIGEYMLGCAGLLFRSAEIESPWLHPYLELDVGPHVVRELTYGPD